MKKFFFLIASVALVMLSCVNTFAQTNPDSLWKVWNNTTIQATARMKALHMLIIDHYVLTQPDTAFILGQTLLTYAHQKGSKKFEAEAYNAIGWSHLSRGDFAEGLKQNKKGLQIAEEIRDSVVIGKCISDIGNSYASFGDYITAYQYYQKALAINRSVGNLLYQSYNLGNIGNVFNMLNDLDRAEEYYRQQLKLNEALKDKQIIAGTTMSLGIIYQHRGDMTKALEYYREGLKLAKEAGIVFSVAYSYGNLTDYYLELKQYDLAAENNVQVKIFADSLHSTSLLALYFCSQCEIDIGLGKYKESVSICEKGLQLAVESGDLELQVEVTRSLYEVNKALKRGDEALAYHEKLLALQDSADKNKTKTDIQRTEFNNQLLTDSLAQVEKDRTIQQEHSRTRNYLIGSSVAVLLLAGGLWGRLRFVRKSRARLQVEKDRSENLLLNILPAEIAEELKEKGRAEARDFDMVSILFTDFKGFTAASEKLSAQELVSEINTCFEAFDSIMGKHGIEKIKTIGDAYMAAGGLPIPSNDSVKNTVLAALDMQAFITKRKAELDAQRKVCFEMRVGIHTGPVVAGIVGVKKFAYDIWGDTVNTASRMESSGAVGQVNISESTYELLKADPKFKFESRGKIEAKNKGEIDMYFVETVSSHE